MVSQPQLLFVDEAIARMGDREIYLEIATFFAQSLPQVIKSVVTAIEQGDLDEGMRLAHSLKSNCATIGAETARQLAFELEKACRDKNGAIAKEMLPGLQEHLKVVGAALATYIATS